ncbi:MAG: alcohol dehydrogenase catalytic domain-containing protein [Lachnospiraceae bacterium]
MKCKQAFMYGPFDLRIEEVELPPLKPDQILIKLKACGICGSDVECYEGKSAEGRYDIAPYTPGHEWAGQAVEVGSAVTSVKVGNKVVGDCVLPCNNCANGGRKDALGLLKYERGRIYAKFTRRNGRVHDFRRAVRPCHSG